MRPPSPLQLVVFVFLMLAIGLACRASDLAGDLQKTLAGTTPVAIRSRGTPIAPVATVGIGVGQSLATRRPTELPTDTLSPTPTFAPSPAPPPTQPPPAKKSAPLATRTPAPPTRQPAATQTFTPAPPPSPTRCPDQFCVVKATCIPGHDTRAIGHIYANGAPLNGIRVRVSNSNGGDPVAADFISGHDPINPSALDPNNPGYYQVGIMEGAPNAGNWWVFLLDDNKNVISEGGFFNTQDQQTGNSCQIGITDFSR